MRILPITSKDNKTLKAMRKPDRVDKILIEGPKLIAEAFAGKFHIEDIVVASSQVERNQKLLQSCADRGARLSEAPDRLVAGIGDTVTSQGIIALASRPEDAISDLPDSPRGIYLVLDAIQDPGNVGALIRSALAFGAQRVIALDGTADPFASKAIRASAGACFHTPIIRAVAEKFSEYCLKSGLLLIALDGAARSDISESAIPVDCAIIVGNEGAGIRTELRRACSTAYRIPIGEQLESLNAAVAASIALYELARRRAIT